MANLLLRDSAVASHFYGDALNPLSITMDQLPKLMVKAALLAGLAGPRPFVHVVDGVPVDGDEAALEWKQVVVDPSRSSRVSHDHLQESWRHAVD